MIWSRLRDVKELERMLFKYGRTKGKGVSRLRLKKDTALPVPGHNLEHGEPRSNLKLRALPC